MQDVTDRGTFESNRGNEIIGQMINGKFSANGLFKGTLAPIITGWRDVIYGSSLKHSPSQQRLLPSLVIWPGTLRTTE